MARSRLLSKIKKGHGRDEKKKKKKKRGTTGTTQRTASGAAVSYTHCDVRTKSPLATTTTTTTVTTVRAPGINTPSKRKRENTRSPWPGLLPAGLASRGWLVRTERPPFGGGGGRWKKKKNGRGRKRKDKRKKIKKKEKPRHDASVMANREEISPEPPIHTLCTLCMSVVCLHGFWLTNAPHHHQPDHHDHSRLDKAGQGRADGPQTRVMRGARPAGLVAGRGQNGAGGCRGLRSGAGDHWAGRLGRMDRRWCDCPCKVLRSEQNQHQRRQLGKTRCRIGIKNS